MIKQTIKIWFDATRPKTLGAAVAPVIIGTALAYCDGAFHLATFIAIIISSTFIQIGTNFANDYFDYIKGADTEERVGPTRATQAGLVSPRSMLFATVVAFGVSSMFGLYLVWRGGLPILIIGVASIIAGVLYTATPYAIGYIGLGELFVLVFFGPVAVGGTYYLQTGRVTLPVLLSGIAPGLLATAILVVNNYRDRFTDAIAGKKTLVVRFGEMFGKAEFTLCIMFGVLSSVSFVFMTKQHYGVLGSLITFFVALPLIKSMYSNPSAEKLNDMLGETGRLLIVYSVLFSLGLLI